MPEPMNPWVMETGSIVFWTVLLAVGVIASVRARRLSLVLLCLLGASSSFWQEFFGDWGAYVAWNPRFDRLPFWGETPFTTPVKPLFIPFSWGWWFALTIPLLVSLTAWLGRRLPLLSTTGWAFATAFPLFLAYQVYAETSAVANGWWTYDVVLGPTFTSARGQVPLIFPFLLGLWAAGLVALLAPQDADGLRWHERRLGVARAAPAWRREIGRLLAFALLFQVTMFAVNIGPAMLARLLFGGASLLVP